MTYPQAVIIGAAIITGALLFSDLSNADEARQGSIAISSTVGATHGSRAATARCGCVMVVAPTVPWRSKILGPIR